MPSSLRSSINTLPDTPGVYLFYGVADFLLYVGKSKTLRSRVRAHFTAREERKMIRRVRRIEIRPTAGELGALLMESKLIKELRPFHNVAAKRRRRIILAIRTATRGGYTWVTLEAVDRIDPEHVGSILGLFKHTTQAREFLAAIARSHRLCPKLLHLEQARTYCFSYHLGRCGGACMGEENTVAYNARVEAAFEERRIKAWPYPGQLVIEEYSAENNLRESFVIDNWCLVETSGGKDSAHRFDYDCYRILYAHVSDPAFDVNKAQKAQRDEA